MFAISRVFSQHETEILLWMSVCESNITRNKKKQCTKYR